MISSLEQIGAIRRNKMYEIQYEEDVVEEKEKAVMQLGQSMEDYLKTIYLLQRQQMSCLLYTSIYSKLASYDNSFYNKGTDS